jgi:hypothetical protein
MISKPDSTKYVNYDVDANTIKFLDLKRMKRNRPQFYACCVAEGLIAEDKAGNPVQARPGQPWLRTYDAHLKKND